MRRRPMQVWPRGQRNAGGSRALLALVVFALLAMLVPSSAAAATPTISYSIDGIAGTNGWWRGSTHGNYIVLHWTVAANPPLTNTVGCDPAISIPGPTPLQGVTKTCTATNDDGNASLSKTIKVDADPPVISKAEVTSKAASDLVRWTSTSPADAAVVLRWPRGGTDQPVVFRGAGSQYTDTKIQAGLEYVYAIQTTDQAGNPSKRITVTGLPRMLTLRKMAYVPRAAPNPILRWPERARRELLPRAALPRLEADPRRLAEHAPDGAPNDLEVGGSPLPAQAREVPLVRLGRHRPPVIREVRPDRQRPLHRSAGIGRCETR